MAVLDGMTVLDLTQQLPGPYATSLLGSLGARIIKIEPPTGDPSRHLDPEMFARVNAGKESVVVDLKSQVGRAALQGLVAQSDVLVEGFRPGVMERLGADWPVCQRANPLLVYCSISGFGSIGPYAQVPVHDMNLMAWGDPEGARRSSGRIGVPWVDLGTGTTAAVLIVSAWHTARGLGHGTQLEVSMQDVALSWSRVKPLRPGVEPTYGVYETKDHKEIVIAILEDHFWERLCLAFQLVDLGGDEILAGYESRVQSADKIHSAIGRRVSELSLADVLALATSHDLPITSVDPADDELAVEQLAATGFANNRFRLPTSASDLEIVSVPQCGEHTERVLTEFGCGTE